MDMKTLREKYADRPKRAPPPPIVSHRIKVLYIRDLEATFGISRRTIWRMVKNGELPKPFKFANKSAWREEAIVRRLEKKQPIR